MRTFKSIAYAFPTSTIAEYLGMAGTGCWYVSQCNINTDGSAVTCIAHNCEGFETPNDPDLIALYREYEGSIDPSFARYGNPDALAAINHIADAKNMVS
jgi:hypothetical protein